MGHNPSRQSIKAASAQAAYAIDEYKARSIWGLWRGLKQEIRDRYFNADEIGWINRYGSRLDQIACMVVEPRNAREKHFLGVCLKHQGPASDRERLWLRTQMVVRFEGALARSARCDKAEQVAAALSARCQQMEVDLQECERSRVEFMPQVWMLQAEAALAKDEAARATRRLTLRNVDRVPEWVFTRGSRDALHVHVMTEATRGPGVILRC